MILNDLGILKFMSENICPFEKENINPASLDLRLGSEWIDISRNKPRPITRDSIWLYPHSTINRLLRRSTLILATTLESINLPDNMYAMVKLKTTPCREGLGHPIADWVDPGFNGELTLMLHAFKPIMLYRGQKICQVVFGVMDGPSLEPYSKKGHYMYQSGPTISWRWKYGDIPSNNS